MPAASINFGTASGPVSCLPLDWGVIIPLAFMPDVEIDYEIQRRPVFCAHIEMGGVIRQAVQKSEKRVALIASCDWSHAHGENGPYGYDPAAKQLDEEVVALLKANEIEKMADFEPGYIEAAKRDGIWQALILAGAIPKASRIMHVLSYEAPTYFGLISRKLTDFVWPEFALFTTPIK